MAKSHRDLKYHYFKVTLIAYALQKKSLCIHYGTVHCYKRNFKLKRFQKVLYSQHGVGIFTNVVRNVMILLNLITLFFYIPLISQLSIVLISTSVIFQVKLSQFVLLIYTVLWIRSCVLLILLLCSRSNLQLTLPATLILP